MTKRKQQAVPQSKIAPTVVGAPSLAFQAIARRTITVIMLFGGVAFLFMPKGFGMPLFITLCLLAAGMLLLKALYIFYPERYPFPLWRDRVFEWRATLERHQQLYLNLLLLIPALIYAKTLNSRPYLLGAIVFYSLFAFWVVLHDVVRTYRAISGTLPGKVLLTLGFAIGSNCAFSFSGVVISEMTQVSATTFPHTLSFLAIGMIPVMIFGVGAAFSVFAMLAIPFVFMVSGMEKDAPGFFTFLFARRFERPARLYPIGTFVFQIVFYAFMGAFSYQMFLKFVNPHGSDIDRAIKKSIYNYDMYPGIECSNMPAHRSAALGDENYILATVVKDEVHFEKPRKCILKEE